MDDGQWTVDGGRSSRHFDEFDLGDVDFGADGLLHDLEVDGEDEGLFALVDDAVDALPGAGGDHHPGAGDERRKNLDLLVQGDDFAAADKLEFLEELAQVNT